VELADFGDPVNTTDYALCVYTGNPQTLAIEYVAPAGGQCGKRPCWKAKTKSLKYKNKLATGYGLKKLILRAKAGAIADLKAIARAPGLILPSMPFPEEKVTVQLVKSDGPKCWQSVMSAPFKKNDANRFKDKSDP
jgi:hypothetical protein